MSIYNIIYQLIADNDCVILPNFGGFVANIFPAEIDFSKQEFYPPTRRVAFNENLNVSDGLLVKTISETENISWEQADEKLANFVNNIKIKLNNNEEVVFDGLGSFTIANGAICFVPSLNIPYSEAFALPTFNFPMLHSATEPHIESAIIKIATDKSKTKHKTRKVLAWSATAAAIIIGTICLSINFGLLDFITSQNDNTMYAGIGIISQQDTNDKQQIATEETVIFTTEAEVELDSVSEEIVEETIEKLPFEEQTEEIVETAELSAVEANNIYIIAGCFSDKNNAEKVLNDLQSLGLSPEILPIYKGLYKVSAKSFSTIEEANSELPSLKEQTGNTSLWILKK